VNILTAAVLCSGWDIDHAGLITTPALQKYVGDHSEYSGGIMVTASHNPPEYNGIKVILENGVEITEETELEISKLFYEMENTIDWKEISTMTRDVHSNVVAYYLDSLSLYIPKELLNKRIVLGLDYANCSSIETIRRLVNLFYNARLVEVNHFVDGIFPGRLPEPTPVNLERTIDVFKRNNIDLGVAFDGDGDRGIIIDTRGRVYWGDEIGTMIAYYLGDELNLKEVITPVSSSILVERVLEPIGIKVIRTRVGAKNIISKMMERGSKLGFEENGGIIYAPHLLARDGGITFVMSLNLIHKMNKDLYRLRERLPSYHQVKTKVRVEKLSKDDKYRLLVEIEEEKIKETIDIDHTDGIKLFLGEDSWVLIRPSGTEPLIRIFAEAKDEKTANHLAEYYKELVEKKIKELSK
jgi:phosphomannomutase/phosphoglucomutase